MKCLGKHQHWTFRVYVCLETGSHTSNDLFIELFPIETQPIWGIHHFQTESSIVTSLNVAKKSQQMFATLCSPPLTKGQREATQDRGSGSERRFRERNWYWQLGFDTFLLRGSLGWFILDHFGYSLDKNLTSQERSRKYDGWWTRKMLIGEGQRCNWLCGAFKLVSGQSVTHIIQFLIWEVSRYRNDLQTRTLHFLNGCVICWL